MAKATEKAVEEKTGDEQAPVEKRTFKKKRAITLPLIKMKEGIEYFLKFDDKMFQAEPLKNLTPEQAKKKPPIMCHVTDLETGEESQIIVNKVLESILNDEFPDDAYVGLAFGITRHPIDEARNKNYATFSVTELDLA